jgi:uncharacterized protein YjbI with pentapeptide repeats
MDVTTNLAAVSMTAATMAANPSALSGQNIRCNIKGDFVLENAVIRRATFTDSKIWRSTIRNVTFENCAFNRTQFMMTEFENVTFKGGSVSGSTSANSEGDLVNFEDSRFINVVLDGVSLAGAYFQVTSRGGGLTLRNLKNIRNRHVTFYIGNSKLVIDNCKASNELLTVLSGERTTVYVNNCEFNKYSGIGGNCKSLYIRNSKFLGFSYIGGGITTVIENSVLTGQIGHANIKELYLVKNQHQRSSPKEPWIGRTVFRTEMEGKVFVDGQNLQDAHLTIVSGHVFIRDLDCVNMVVGTSDPKLLETKSLDLYNVKIKGIHFLDLNLISARWENVVVEPTIEMENSKIAKLQIYNVELPEEFIKLGNSKDNSIKITQSVKSFNFPSFVTPTPEALGVRVE